MTRPLFWPSILLLVWMLAGCRASPRTYEPAIPMGAETPRPTATFTSTPQRTSTAMRPRATPPSPSAATATRKPLPPTEEHSTPTSIPTPSRVSTPSAGGSEAPLPTPSPEEILIGRREGRMVHIGFDVEGDPRILDELLTVLEEEGYRTTFFLQGEWVQYHPEATKRIAAAGHELGNHSWSHPDMRTLDEAGIEREIRDTEALVWKLTGRSTKPFFRPPYGLRNALVREVAYRLGYTTVIWTFGAQDWEPNADENSVYRNLVDHAAPGVIFYLHTSHNFNPPAVRRAIRTLRERGFRLVSLSELVTSPSEP